jgi:hypothetical protein
MSASDAGPEGPPAALTCVSGGTIVYRIYDVGYAIQLERASELLAADAPERLRPVRGEAQAIQIPNPPITVALGSRSETIADEERTIELSARLFDFGVVSLRARLASPPGASWAAFVAHGAEIGSSPLWADVFPPVLERLLARIAPAIEKAGASPLTEDYVVHRIHRLEGPNGERIPPDQLPDEDIARLLLGERRPLAASAQRELLSPRFSYFEDDLAVLAWGAALVVEPVAADTDVQYVLEFANAQLLELRFYDSVLDAELPAIVMQSERARRTFHLMGRGYGVLLGALQRRVADAIEVVERIENSLKVTDDVFLARIYAAALDLFKTRTWRSGIDRKVRIVRDTYDMLNAESLARRSEALELIVVALIALEIVLALFRR